jgi:hypothetical protein
MLRYDSEAFRGLSRARFLEALKAEGIPASPGYKEPLSQVAAVQREIQAQSPEEPWTPPELPVTDRACTSEAVWLGQNVLLGSRKDLDDVVVAIEKIQRYSGDLVREA